jgi:2-oxoisovalerate dehydrogenase E1 component
MPVNAKVAAKLSQESIPFSSAEEARKLFYLLLKGRLVDEGNRKLFRTGKFLGTYYSAVGQEATTIVPAFLLRREDIIAPQHREIGCSIGREVPLNLMMAHNMGRKSGFDKGKNHPCHYGGTKWNIITPASTMAAQTVVGTGCALAFKLQKKDNVVIAFTGEGGTSQAGWHEA